MTAFGRDLAARIALGGALLVSACQHDSSASFDDSVLEPPDAGGSSNTAGSDADAGTTSQGAVSSGGSKATAGNPAGGTANAGAAGSAGGGNATGGAGGKAGADAGGAAGKAGQGSTGGTAGGAGRGGMAGMGGGKNPGPVTIEITDIADTDVSSCLTNANYGEEKTINVDGDDGSCVIEALINAPLQQIPDGAVVTEATLTLNCVNVGDPATVSFVNEPWAEDSVRWDNRPNVGATIGSVSCDSLGKVTIDLKAAVKAWLAKEHEPYGIYLRMQTSDGIDFSTSEADDEADRPTLTITYNMPAK